MTQRYFVDAPISGERVTLTDGEAHHLLHVMRARAGSEVVLFDGRGAQYRARVETLGRGSVELTVLARDQPDRELTRQVWLGVALPKGERQKWLVEKAVELGVQRLVPLRTRRGVAQPVEQALARLRRAVIEASKQCGRNRLMQITEPSSWQDYLVSAPNGATRFIAHRTPGADAPRHLVPGDCVLLAVGPEGGFTEEEITLGRAAGWRLVDLGPRILRVETAAILLSALVSLGSETQSNTADAAQGHRGES